MTRRAHLLATTLTVTALLVPGSHVIAQMTPAGPTAQEQATSSATERQDVPSTIANEQPLTYNEPREITARLVTPPDDERLEGLNLSDVRLRGRASPQFTTDQRYLDIEWTEVYRVSNEVDARLPRPLASTISTETEEVPSGSRFSARGDQDSLVVGIQRLFEEQIEPEPEAEEEPEEQRSAANNAPTAGGTAPTNDIAAGYEPMQFEPGEDEPDPIFGTTLEGCAPRIDMAQMAAIEQSRPTRDGIPEGECTDTLTRFPIEKSYSGCDDIVNLPDMNAQPSFRHYYSDNGGRTVYIDSECQPDPDLIFGLREDTDACPVFPNHDLGAAQQQAQLVYTSRTNQREVVRDCAPTDVSWPIQTTTENCNLRHDYQGGVSYLRDRSFYVDDNEVEVTIRSCADTVTTYDHVKIDGVCDYIVNLEDNVAIPQHRLQITTPDGNFFISECTPDDSLGTPVLATVDGCDTQFFHYENQGQSYGAERYYHMNNAGERVYVTSCQQSATTYLHQVEITGYRYNDPQAYANPITALYINTPTGRVDVSGPTVRSGAAEIPYTFNRTDHQARPTEVYYEGCNAFTPTTAIEVYDRPDGTEAFYVVGDGPQVGPTDECTRTTETRNTFTHLSFASTHGRTSTAFNDGSSHISDRRTDTVHGRGPYTSCGASVSQLPRPAGSITWTNYHVNQSRVRTVMPNGAVTHSPWATSGAPFAQSSFSCSWTASESRQDP